MATALETSLANLASSQATLTAAINRIVSCCSNTTTTPTPAPTSAPPTAPTPAPTSAPPTAPTTASTPPNCTYVATLEEQQSTNCYNISLPKGFINVTVINEDPNDGFVNIQANNGDGAVINIKTTVVKDAVIGGVSSYEARTGGKIYINP